VDKRDTVVGLVELDENSEDCKKFVLEKKKTQSRKNTNYFKIKKQKTKQT
jgi:hypothetical protein